MVPLVLERELQERAMVPLVLETELQERAMVLRAQASDFRMFLSC